MKKFLVVLLAVMCMFSLTACGGGSTESDASSQAEDGVVYVKIGGSGPLTGDAKEYGLAVKNAAEIAVEEINASDSKIKFELKFEDDMADPEKSPVAYDALYDWGMQVSLYTVTSGAGAAVASSYDEDKIFALTPSGSSTDLVYTSDGTNYKGNFQMCFTDPNQGIASAEYIGQNFADAKVAVIYKIDDVYSKGVYDKFIAAAETNGVNIVSEQSFKDGDTDFGGILTTIQAAGADFIYLPMYYQPASQIILKIIEMEYDAKLFGIDGMDGILTMISAEQAEGIYLLTPFDANATDDLTKNFVASYTERCDGLVPNQFAADAYDCVYAIHAALENIGAENIESCDLYNELINQFLTMKFDGLTGSGMNWSENGEVSKLPKCVQIKDGVYASVE